MPIKVMVVDDSAFMRKIISDMLQDLQDIEVVGTARNGKDALEMIPRLRPDLITLDVEMPELNGIETLKEIKRSYDVPVIMLSSNKNPETTIEALEHGAVDFIEKPEHIQTNIHDIQSDMDEKIKSCLSWKGEEAFHQHVKQKSVLPSRKSFDAVVIGASTGGPKALVQLVRALPKDMRVPVFIVQHMPKGFTASLAERMDKESQVHVVEARHGMAIRAGTVYLAPGDHHMQLKGSQIHLDSNEKIHGVRPAVDHLFRTASEKYRDRLLGVILTGMGKDGSSGMVAIKEHGGYNLAQDKETSIVYGMPGSAISRGVVDEVLSLDEVSRTLNKWTR